MSQMEYNKGKLFPTKMSYDNLFEELGVNLVISLKATPKRSGVGITVMMVIMRF